MSRQEQTGGNLSPIAQQFKAVETAVKGAATKIAQVLPQGLDPTRFITMALLYLQNNTWLLNGEPKQISASFRRSVLESAMAGLEIGSALGHAYLVRYKNTVTFIPGYKGLAHLAYQSPRIALCDGQAVYKQDVFEYAHGTEGFLRHVQGKRPNWKSMEEQVGDIIAYWGMFQLANGKAVFRVFTPDDVAKIRARSPAARENKGPWTTDPVPMGVKCPFRNAAKFAPLTTLASQIAARDEQYDAGVVDIEPLVADDEGGGAGSTTSRQEKEASQRQAPRSAPTQPAGEEPPHPAETVGQAPPGHVEIKPGPSQKPKSKTAATF